MGPKTGAKKHVNKQNILVVTKEDLRTMTKSRENASAASSCISFNRNKRLENPQSGGRFLIMRKKVDKESDDTSMRKINPIMLARLLRGIGDIDTMKIIHDGGLLIKTKTYVTANSIFQIVGIPCHEVVVQEYTQLNKSMGVIFDRSLTSATDDDIMEELKKHHCIKVKRVSKTGKNGEKYDTGTFFITFGTIKLPSYITIGYTSHNLEPYIPNPTRCFKCQRFGHVSNACKAPEKICVNCGDIEHTTDGEKCSKAQKCVNCKSDSHNSMARECPEFTYRKKIEEIKVMEMKSHIEATRLLDARDPRANPANLHSPSFSSVVGRSGCACKCTCNKQQPTPEKKTREIRKPTAAEKTRMDAPPITTKRTSSPTALSEEKKKVAKLFRKGTSNPCSSEDEMDVNGSV